MCLSPQVDVVAGLAITVVAIDAARHCHHRRTAALAALPAIFAVHTFASALVWWGLRGAIPGPLGDWALVFYLVVAFVILPVYVPLAVLLIEPRGWRRICLIVLTAAGAGAGIDFLLGILAGSARAVACSYYIDFRVLGTSTLAGGIYVLATCGALLLSGQRPLLYWGMLNVVVVSGLCLWVSRGMPSLWCFWAACTSGFVAWYLRYLERRRGDGEPWPWEQQPGSSSLQGSSGVTGAVGG